MDQHSFHLLMATISVGMPLVDPFQLDLHPSLIKVMNPQAIVFEDFKAVLLCLFGPQLI